MQIMHRHDSLAACMDLFGALTYTRVGYVQLNRHRTRITREVQGKQTMCHERMRHQIVVVM